MKDVELNKYLTIKYAKIVTCDNTTDGNICFIASHPELPGCMAHGNNAIDLVMQLKGWDFKAALEYLSRF